MDIIKELYECFDTKGRFISAAPYGNGHINDTYIIEAELDGAAVRYVLQRINHEVFREPYKLMENFAAVTEYLQGKQDELASLGQTSLSIVKTKAGENLLKKNGRYFRLLSYIEGSVSYDKVESREQFYECAKAFGAFQRVLRDFPAEKLYETIKDFHNTPERLRQLEDAAALDKKGRLAEVMPELEFARARKDFAGALIREAEAGRLPIKVTYNDTKLNNILFDEETKKPVCIVDLDTVMPGFSVNDFGDSIRFGATTAAEDESNLDLVHFDIELFEIYAKGFIEGAGEGLTECEIAMLPTGAVMMTLECGMRFLADYLSGDVYFKTSRPKHNLDRARNQFKLVSEMEARFDEMTTIVRKYIKN